MGSSQSRASGSSNDLPPALRPASVALALVRANVITHPALCRSERSGVSQRALLLGQPQWHWREQIAILRLVAASARGFSEGSAAPPFLRLQFSVRAPAASSHTC